MLQTEALVVAEAQRGFHVSPVSEKELRSITQARIEVEKWCLASAIAHGDLDWESRVVAAMHRLSHFGQAHPTGEHQEKWAQEHAEFHHALASGCDNEWLLRMRATLYEQSERYRWLSVSPQSQERDVLGEHQSLMAFTLKRDTAGATAVLERHLNETAQRLLASGFLAREELASR
jgi:DNA-binding GntR family transcriptional regulator